MMSVRHRPKRSLGQNFLIDKRTIQKIINVCGLNSQDVVLEIGPGQGALTALIAESVKKLIAVEKDHDLAAALSINSSSNNIEIMCGDILEFDWEKIGMDVKVIGNLPYNVATPIIEKIIQHRRRIKESYIMLQLEHANRLVAKPCSKEYGSLSCFVQYYADVKKMFTIKNTCFNPKPKVDSCFLLLRPLDKARLGCLDEDLLFRVIRAAFNYRRKTLLNSLGLLYKKDSVERLLARAKISSKRRAEELSLEEYVGFVNGVVESKEGLV